MARRPLGPGPGAYQLPTTFGYENHDNRKQRMPQYSLGQRIKIPGESSGPGPGAYQVTQLTRNGKADGPMFSLAPLTPNIEKPIGPGPAAHEVHLKPIMKGVEAPAYTIAPRQNFSFKNYGPGPSAYMVEVAPVKTTAPAFSLGVQLKDNSTPNSPGPGAYAAPDLDLKLNRAPKYSMRSRCDPKLESVGPGPNYYNLADHRPGKTAGAYSFGVRHSPYAPPMIVKCDNM